MILNHLFDDGQPQAGALFARGDIGLHQITAVGFGKARPVSATATWILSRVIDNET